MESPGGDNYRAELAAAVMVGGTAAVATFTPGELPTWVSAVVTLFASVAGWALGRILTSSAHRLTNGVLAAALAVASVVLVVAAKPERCAPDGVVCFVGGCQPYSVYAQNRYLPLGALIRAEPRREAREVGSFAPNKLVPIDGWVRTRAAYPHNSPPYDSDYWFHLADDRGWVAFAGVRADPTTPAEDPFDTDGGAPAPAPPECHGAFRD